MHVHSFYKYFLSHNLHSDMFHKFNSLSWAASTHNTDIFLKSVLVYTAGSLHFLWREVLNGLNSTCSLNYRQIVSHPLQHFWEKLHIYISSSFAVPYYWYMYVCEENMYLFHFLKALLDIPAFWDFFHFSLKKRLKHLKTTIYW